jgi:hypothetical protein
MRPLQSQAGMHKRFGCNAEEQQAAENLRIGKKMRQWAPDGQLHSRGGAKNAAAVQ